MGGANERKGRTLGHLTDVTVVTSYSKTKVLARRVNRRDMWKF